MSTLKLIWFVHKDKRLARKFIPFFKKLDNDTQTRVIILGAVAMIALRNAIRNKVVI